MHLQTALAVEAEAGFSNVHVRAPPPPTPHPGPRASSLDRDVNALPRRVLAKGRVTHVSTFLGDQLAALAHQSPAWLPRDAALGRLAGAFHDYAQLATAERCALVQDAQLALARCGDALRHWRSLGGAAAPAVAAPAVARSPAPAPEPPPSPAPPSLLLADTGGQRTASWFQRRESLLTGSQFASALGCNGEQRLLELWEERVGLRPRFTGNSATQWGTDTEAMGVAAYTSLTGCRVAHADLGTLSAPPGQPAWLGASPDGLLTQHPGVLEVKCPVGAAHFRYGAPPQEAKPYPAAPHYYVPQMLGLLAVFDRQFADLFCYTTLHGCALFRVQGDPVAWAAMQEALREFWFLNVLPARRDLQDGASAEDVRNLHRPVSAAGRVAAFRAANERISQTATVTHFASPRPEELQALIRAAEAREVDLSAVAARRLPLPPRLSPRP